MEQTCNKVIYCSVIDPAVYCLPFLRTEFEDTNIMSLDGPINLGQVQWAGDNPGIYLKNVPSGDWSALGLFFRVSLSPYGRGHTMIVLDEPDSKSGYPESNNICLTDNKDLTQYLIENFVSKFPSFQGKPSLDEMAHLDLEEIIQEGDMKTVHREIARGSDVEVVMEWRDFGEPFAVEVRPPDSATKAHDMYSLFIETTDASISVNGKKFSGRVADRQFFGKTMSTAFLALSEIWIKP